MPSRVVHIAATLTSALLVAVPAMSAPALAAPTGAQPEGGAFAAVFVCALLVSGFITAYVMNQTSRLLRKQAVRVREVDNPQRFD
ncbi:hypothetical protein [Cucumibacter marinus]|uniref:hypothetical protein n=1 Tax=Cucumibacter marinus TaxID=1121252 RepID=UPI00041FFA5F|nr:hypothetical protein [Cucumibacter marinus]